MAASPYSYVTSGGVHNTRVKSSSPEETLDDLREAFAEPVQLAVPSIKYHNGTKRERSDVKKALSYFIGGVLSPNKRDDANVKSRTLLTLDIEQGEHDDGPPPAPDLVAQRIQGLGGSGWVYTSLSHTPGSPRYRVVLPLGKPITGDTEAMQAALKASTLQAAERLGIKEWCKPESWVLSQPMYLPAKLKGGAFYESHHTGKGWSAVRGDADGAEGSPDRRSKAPADIPDERPDHVLNALKQAGLYLRPNPKHKGMHFITCPFADQHEAENDTQTVYYEAHFDGNPRPAVKCFDTAPDVDGEFHLTFHKLVRWLKAEGHLTDREQAEAGVLDDADAFRAKADLGRLLDTTPVEREWAIEQLAPVGKVTVLAGPGGVSKSMLMLHVLVHAAMGQQWAEFAPRQPVRSLYVSYEDDQQELHKRTHALAADLRLQDDGVLDTLYDVNGSIRKNLLMFATDEEAPQWLLLTKPDRFGPAERTERVEWLVSTLKYLDIKLLVLDPAVYTHQLEENSIADMAQYMQTLTHIAKQAGVAVIVLHHMNKMSGWAALDDIHQGSLRGASSFADNARSVAVLVGMPIKDAANYGLPPEQATTSRYAVLKHVKHNYSAPLKEQVFERKGPRLIPRPDIVKLDSSAIKEVQEHQKAEASQAVILSNAVRVMQALCDHDDFLSSTALAVESKVHKRRMAEVLEYCAEQDWIETEDGPKGARMSRVTKAGRAWFKLKQHEDKR
jgi:regulatory protein RepA